MEYRIGDVITGKVTGIQPYGVFVLLDDKTQGLIHISECQHGFVKDISHLFKVGQVLRVMILDIDEYTQKISLSLRALDTSIELSSKRTRKHYWTNRKVQQGFAPIAEALLGWVSNYLDDLEA
ncbi:CvfD/Ygs/GSP13 family RNA-binding post-transcriptional regulator [Lacticaseibacillus brantae]|uniref:RNA-binding protein n=1 Tax=Lacticaseibacillus brantae DSM 23927 TaxID=1423727 RepID=A0A0R2B2R7_9LACO|nr:CvfD/Ygs/GSP13 family RNA-binding post-transcriptional regulator [Lacticaseibacillus brantae]KRM72260.1 RNA-binding protein [Lacticaseibacillus brantae DSM 23927]